MYYSRAHRHSNASIRIDVDVGQGGTFCPQKDHPHPITGAAWPQTLGHEFSGIISEIGSNVQGFKVGQRVCVNPCMDDRHHGLQTCVVCANGCPNVCMNVTFYGINGVGGGFASEIVVKHFSIVPLPDDVSLKLGALVEPLAVAAHMVRISGFAKDQDAVVLGAGPIGSALVFMLREVGARKIVVSEISTSRSEQAKSAGAHRVINPVVQDVLAEIRKDMPDGSDVAFEACGLQATLDTAIACVKPGGTIFNVSVHEKPVTINMNLLTMREKKLLSGNAYTQEDINKVVDILRTKGSELESFITAIVPLETAVKGAFEELVKNRSKHNKILVQMNVE